MKKFTIEQIKEMNKLKRKVVVHINSELEHSQLSEQFDLMKWHESYSYYLTSNPGMTKSSNEYEIEHYQIIEFEEIAFLGEMKEFKTEHQLIVDDTYLNRFLKLNSAEDLLHFKFFPNAKEITESFAMVNAVETYLTKYDKKINRNNPNICIYVVGDGQKPRTAALFAFLTKWQCRSIDPDLQWLNEKDEIKNLKCYKNKIEDFRSKNTNDKEIAIIIMPHSHANIHQSWLNIFFEKKWLINMECCGNGGNLPLSHFSYVDDKIYSPKNRIDIYCNYIAL